MKQREPHDFPFQAQFIATWVDVKVVTHGHAPTSARITGMSFSVKLLTEALSVEPGGSVPVAMDVVNEGAEPDRYELTVEGVDPEWVAVPVPSFVLEPGQGQTGRFFLKPPRESHSMAGNYPFVARVRSLESGNTQEVQGVLEVKAYTHLSVDVQPRKVTVSPFRRSADLRVNIANLGNTDQTLQLFATDTDDVLAFEFDQDQIRVNPGQQDTVALTASAGSSPFLANPRLQPVTVSARSVSNASHGASTSLQVEQRGLLSVANALVVVVIAAVLLIWYLAAPKPPTVDNLVAIPMSPTVGDTVTIKWSASNAQSVELNVGGTVIDKLNPTGEYPYTPKTKGPLTISATAVSENRRSKTETQVITIVEKVVAPDPVILSFSATPTTAKVGEKVTVSYQVNEAVTNLYLSPYGPLEPKGSGYSFTPDKPGDIALKLTARNQDGKVVEQQFQVHVNVVSDAVIDTFEASPLTMESVGGPVQLRWAIQKAAKVELSYDDQHIAVPPQNAGTQLIPLVNATTTFTLTATDEKGVSVSKKVKVTVNPPEQPQPKTPETPGDIQIKVPIKKPETVPPATTGGGRSPKMPGGR